VTAKISNLLLDYKIQVTTIKYKIDQITDRVRATHTHTQEILYYRDCDTRLKNSTCVNGVHKIAIPALSLLLSRIH